MSTFSVQATITAIDKASPAIRAVRKSMLGLAQNSAKVNAAFKTMANLKPFGSSGMKGFGSDAKKAAAGVAAIAASLNTASRAAGGLSAQLAKINAQLSRQKRINLDEAGSRRRYSGYPRSLPEVVRHRAANSVYNRGRDAVVGTGSDIVGESSDRYLIKLENLPKDLQEAINKGSRDAIAKYRTLSQAEVNQVTRGAVGNLDNMNPEVAKKLPEALAKFIQTEKSRLGSDKTEAKYAAQRGAKMADLAGKANTTERLKDFLDTYSRAGIANGPDLRSEKVLRGFKALGTLGITMNKSATMRSMLMFDETDASGGNELNQMVSVFSSDRVAKKIKAAQTRAGLRDAKTGRAVDETLLRTNPFEWLEKYITGKGGYLQKQGVNIKDGKEDTFTRAAIALEKITSRDTSFRALNRESLKEDERKRQEEKGNRADLSDETIQRGPSESIALAGEAVARSFGQLADRLTQDLQPKLTGALDSLSKSFVKAASDVDQYSTIRGGALAGSAVLAGGVATLKHIYENPGQSALTAAIGLNTAAVTANTAAQGLGGLGGKGVGKGVGLAGKLLRFGGALTALTITVEAFAYANRVWNKDLNSDNEEGKQLRENVRKKEQARREKMMEARAFAEKNGADPDAGENARFAAQLSAQLAAKRAQLAKLVNDNTEKRTKRDKNYGREGERGLAMMNLAQPIQAAHEAGAAKVGSSIGESAGKLASSGTQFGANATGPIVGSANAWGAIAAGHISRAAANIKGFAEPKGWGGGSANSGGIDTP